MANYDFDVVIVGASFGGVAAAFAVADTQKNVVLIDAGTMVGGQATSQGVTRWDETSFSTTPRAYGSTKSYRTLKDDIRRWYRDHTTLAADVDGDTFNPGWYGPGQPFRVDCNVVKTVMDQSLQDRGRYLTQMLGSRVTRVNSDHGTITSVTLANGDTVSGTMFVDATDLGELLPLANISWFAGAEAQSTTHEPNAEAQAQPRFIQPFTVPIAIENMPDTRPGYLIQQPDDFDALAEYQGFTVVDPNRNGDLGGVLKDVHHLGETVFNYRQYIDHRNFNDPNYKNDRTTINCGCNDYQRAVIPTESAQEDANIVEAGRQTSRAYMWWLQNEAPHDEGAGKGFKNLKVRTDTFGREDGTAPLPYIRESRRIAKPLVQIHEQDIAVPTMQPLPRRAPKNFSDSVGIGHYHADVHKCWGPPPATPYKEVGEIGVFQIPLGSLIPSDASNYIAGCKNLGTTHVTSSAYRVHPIEWAIGEAAGVLAAYCVGQGVTPAQAYADDRPAGRRSALQLRMLERGAPIFWWDDVSYEDDKRTFAATQFLGVRGLFSGEGQGLGFDPSGEFARAQQDRFDPNHEFDWGDGTVTRAQAAVIICEGLGIPLPS
jgi:hypothetical protein